MSIFLEEEDDLFARYRGESVEEAARKTVSRSIATASSRYGWSRILRQMRSSWKGSKGLTLFGNAEFYMTSLELVTGCTFGCRHCIARYELRSQAPDNGIPLDDPMRPTPHPETLNKLFVAPDRSIFMLCPRGDLFDPQVPSYYRSYCFDILKSVADKGHLFYLFTRRYKSAVMSFSRRRVIPGLCLVFSAATQSAADEAWVHLRKIRNVEWRGLALAPVLESISIPGNERCQPDWVYYSGDQLRRIPNTPSFVSDIADQCNRRGIPHFFKEYGQRNSPDRRYTRHRNRKINGVVYNYMVDGREYETPCKRRSP